jgi:hypothetical protein
MEGDAVAATAIIRVIVARCRLLGPTFESVLSRSANTATVVVPPGDLELPFVGWALWDLRSGSLFLYSAALHFEEISPR